MSKICLCGRNWMYIISEDAVEFFQNTYTGYPDSVAQHFHDHGHCADDLKVIGIEKNHGDDVYRGVKEHLWIKKLNTFKPNGINTKE